MAKAATAESVAKKDKPPKFREAVQLVRGGIEAVRTKIGEHNSKIAEHYGTIEGGYGVNKKATKMFAGLDKLDPSDRQDVLRSFRGLCEAADWPESRDLMDMADKAGADASPDDAKSAKLAKPGKPLSAAAAKEAAKNHLRVVGDEPKPEAPAAASADPDADLAGE